MIINDIPDAPHVELFIPFWVKKYVRVKRMKIVIPINITDN